MDSKSAQLQKLITNDSNRKQSYDENDKSYSQQLQKKVGQQEMTQAPPFNPNDHQHIFHSKSGEYSKRQSYLDKAKYGGVGDYDSSDEQEGDLENYDIQSVDNNQSKRMIKLEKEGKSLEKLGFWGTYFTLIKGFIGTGIIYLPKSFINAGFGFSIVSLIICAIITIQCIFLLLDVRVKLGRTISFTEIGSKLYGNFGYYFVAFSLGFSQFGFVCAYIYFIRTNYALIAYKLFDLDQDHTKFTVAIICFFVFSLLCMVRKIEIFANTHIFADIMIVLTLCYIVIQGAIKIGNEGVHTDTPFISDTWSLAIGFSVYAFEGVGTILPVYDITQKPEEFKKVVYYVVGTCTFLYIFFGQFCTFAWGLTMTKPLATDNLIQNAGTYIILILFSFNLLFTYPLVLYPVHQIIESIIYKDWVKSRKRQIFKNFTRSLLVAITILFTISLGDKLDKFLSILGAISCTPIAFTIPAMFHLKAAAETQAAKYYDKVIIVIFVFIQIFCTIQGFQSWNS